ncbi:hypothetical protein GBF38_018399 [Nibea albiflora]|uniref:Uncharacterized protein n=1 Tax=Nibea albiflora TaxID=240163 RepID=A0ACB7EFL3_NIBAL|nr:hypothetical protein GBF38_018399 [Nibea albiflora]
MDGEFDRELNDDGWGPNSTFKTAEEQLWTLEQVVGRTHNPKEAAAVMKQMREDVGKLLAEKGKTMQDKGSLVKEFWRIEQRARREKDRAEQEQKSGGWRNRSKIKNNMEKAEQEKMKWAKWAMWWQGVGHIMTNPKAGRKQDRTKSNKGPSPILSSSSP